MEDNQFYPTPPPLALRMWGKFERSIHRRGAEVLDPSAGRADLVEAYVDDLSYHYKASNVDMVEIDFDNQAVLRAKGFDVVGHDFLQFSSAKSYTHIIMNPPFSHGAEHVLHAYDLLKDGELVALVNAETIKNPKGKYQERLCRVINDAEGVVEYVSSAFTTEDTKRKTDVECAIVYLVRAYDYSDLAFLDNLRPDLSEGKANQFEVADKQELAIRQDVVKNAVTLFNAAVAAMETEVRVKAKLVNSSEYYSSLLGDSLLKRSEPSPDGEAKNLAFPLEEFNSRYKKLKEQAWSHVLKASDVANSLSSKVKESILSEFENVSSLEFTAENVYGFLLGLIEGRGDMNLNILLEVFDRVTEYHTGNRAWYKGWKSNDKHKTNAYRMKMSRFILPVMCSDYSLDYRERQKLKDFDIAFSLLGGVSGKGLTTLEDLFSGENFTRLKCGERLSSEYFDVRYYHRAGTTHFFPRKRELVDRLNRIVGRERQWLPPEGERVSDSFWLQYEKAEKITTLMDKESDVHNQWPYKLNEGKNAEEIEALIDNAGKALNLPMDGLLDCQECGEDYYALSSAEYAGKRVAIVKRDDWIKSK